MSGHISIERMNDALDGLLSAAEMTGLNAHVDSCAACRQAYARLSETVEAIRSLPVSAAAPDEAWSGIAARIRGTEPGAEDRGADVVPLPTASRGPRTFSFSMPQLAAAAVVIAVVSASTMWLATRPAQTGSADRVVAGSTAGAADGPAARAVVRASATARYEEVVLQLQAILDQGRSSLAPETLEVIEGSLTTVNQAIADVEAALAEEPNSDMLLRMLAAQQRTKLGVLQRAAEAVRAQT